MKRSLSRPWVGGLVLAGVTVGAALPMRAADRISLAALDLSHVEQGWGTAQRDRSVDGHLLRICGQAFERGLGTHSPGSFLVDLNGGSSLFRAKVGIDDEVGTRGSSPLAGRGYDSSRAPFGPQPERGQGPAVPVHPERTGQPHVALGTGAVAVYAGDEPAGQRPVHRSAAHQFESNWGEMPVSLRWADLGIAERGLVTDLWERVSREPGRGIDTTLAPHGCHLYRLNAPVVE